MIRTVDLGKVGRLDWGGGLKPLLSWNGKVEAQAPMLSLLAEFALFLREHKKLWLLPIVVALGLIGALLIAVEGSVLSPFIYTIF